MAVADPRSRVVAVLGPTNTGKTHLAMERMLGHASGMIGFPLRLLARENYDRAVRARGGGSVALITGEEKIVPPGARYFLCTVESMPIGRRVAFLGVDEIQMCADPDRGHIFTDRLLHARGDIETMFMGAETVRPHVRRLLPEAEIVTRPRFSKLCCSGQRKIQRLPPRTAIVAFTAADVYAIAELIRRHRGGAAVVLGALSPRTRNAQVAMYQAGEVDYLVATDAIGMGLNMDINHVAFAATRKFDGRHVRLLSAAELAQIAGRAGRHMNDGTFGTTADTEPLDADSVERIESHQFDPLPHLFWRNVRLNFTSLEALLGSLARSPDRPGLLRVREADDELVLAALARDAGISELARGADALRLLWDVCQIPDFRKVMSDAHARLVGRIYLHLAGSGAAGRRLPADWVARQVDRLDRVDGDIETLMQRIAGIRTWTYIAYRGDWIDEAGHWQERTRGIEDKLSDALHERLVQRFVDRRTSVLIGRMRHGHDLVGLVNAAGEVLVEGEFVGTLEGFRFLADPTMAAGGASPGGTATRIVNSVALRALRGEVKRRVRQIETDPEDAFSLTPEGTVLWQDAPVAKLMQGPEMLRPGIEVWSSDLLSTELRERVRRRLAAWLCAYLETHLRPLFRAREAALSGPARGLVFATTQALGSVPRWRVSAQVNALAAPDRRAVRRLGLRIGRRHVFFHRLLKPDTVALRGLLWAVCAGVSLPNLPPAGRVSVPVDRGVPTGFQEAIGYEPLGRRALRVDAVERILAGANAFARRATPGALAELQRWAGCGTEELVECLAALGFEAEVGASMVSIRRLRAPSRAKSADTRAHRTALDRDSPFAKLRHLQVGK